MTRTYFGAVSLIHRQKDEPDDDAFQAITNTQTSRWLVQAGFTCVDEDGNTQEVCRCNNVQFFVERNPMLTLVVQEADCYFGPVFNGTFDEGSIANENFNLEYADGEFLTGVLGYENVTVAGITVDHQEVALVNYSYWFGDNVTSGLIGLAYPLLTSAYNGTDPDADSLETQVEYNPIITTMIDEGLIDPVFSLSLDRNSDGGYLALGGLPPVNYSGTFATTPILMVSIPGELRTMP